MELWRRQYEGMLFPESEGFNALKALKYASELSEVESSATEITRDANINRLRTLLLLCFEHVPAYAFLRHERLEIEKDPESALKRFPVFDSGLFRKDTGMYLNDACPREGLVKFSTDAGVDFYMSAENAARREGERIFVLNKLGLSQASKALVLEHGRDIDEKSGIFAGIQRRTRSRISITYDDMENAERTAALLKRVKPDYVCGSPGTVYSFSNRMIASGEGSAVKLKGALFFGHGIYPEWRKLISETFGCETVCASITRDFGLAAYSCVGGFMHLNEHARFFETGDGGEILMTDLADAVMPRLREGTGFFGTIENGTCSCGLSTQRIAMKREVKGNGVDFRALYEAMLRIEEVFAFRLELNPPELTFVTSKDSAQSRVEHLMSELFGHEAYSVRRAGHILTDNAGFIAGHGR